MGLPLLWGMFRMLWWSMLRLSLFLRILKISPAGWWGMFFWECGFYVFMDLRIKSEEDRRKKRLMMIGKGRRS